jgi:hypothetical protein
VQKREPCVTGVCLYQRIESLQPTAHAWPHSLSILTSQHLQSVSTFPPKSTAAPALSVPDTQQQGGRSQLPAVNTLEHNPTTRAAAQHSTPHPAEQPPVSVPTASHSTHTPASKLRICCAPSHSHNPVKEAPQCVHKSHVLHSQQHLLLKPWGMTAPVLTTHSCRWGRRCCCC